MIRTTRFLLIACALFAFSGALFAQTETTPPLTPLQRNFARLDFALAGVGQFGKSVSGAVPQNGSPDQGNTLTEKPSNTLGALGTIRFSRSPWVGLEFNYTYARYTETFTNNTTAQPEAPGQIQTQVNESTFGYLVEPAHPLFGLQPFASVGGGSTRFRPTRGGGESSPLQWRATYYYSVGLQKEFGDSHFGARVGLRQAFFLAPDFEENYLTILKHTYTVEPNFGFYVRF